MDWSEKNLCIKCDKGGNVLVCSENGCPISVHEECMGCPARFNDAGNFYCPYCLYKEAVSESSRARKDAMEKKKALLIFIGEEPKNGEKPLAEYEKSKGEMHKQSKDAAVNDTVGDDSVSDKGVYEERVSDDDEDPEEETIQGDDDSKALSVEEDEGSDASSESRDQDPSFQLHEEPKKDDEIIEDDISEASSESIREVESPVRMHLRSNRGGTKRSLIDEDDDDDDDDDDAVLVQKKRTKTSTGDKDKQTCEETVDTPRRSSRRRPVSGLGNDEDADIRSELPQQQPETSTDDKDKQACEETMDTPRRSSRRRSVSSPKIDEDADRRSELPQQQPSVKPPTLTFGNAKKRTPLLWSQKEEDILEKGVTKFSEPDKKLPWKKILEYGRKVFHNSRTPTDLKDKWRKMVATK